jgi:hypothetical protein
MSERFWPAFTGFLAGALTGIATALLLQRHWEREYLKEARIERA